ncbi:mandelate racemase/muconate lactonizing enzyme family protein [Paenibacillus oceani]|uniref:Muconate cycloisomerase n=1 Tax=Paenibacillus oceani TaxID=2772510 RepID=A0A927GYC4_9BACL|nr:enolase C-terminal domain-like protein [Paenibacillus oceani]MBD2861455.1 muconate cycloisomerase [Paenibacillus oceani]
MTRIAKIDVWSVRVPGRRVFELGNGSKVTPGGVGRPVMFIRMETDDGIVGWGEQRANPMWHYETIETMVAAVRHHLAPLALGLSPYEIGTFHKRAEAAMSISVSNGMPFARAAMDIAFHDLAGKMAGLPLHALLGGALVSEVPLCSAIGIDRPEVMAANAAESSAYTAYKIKISGDIAEDARRIRKIVETTGSNPLWLDANQSYTPGTIWRMLESIRDISTVACVEQPVKSHDWNGMASVRMRCGLPVAIDEGSFSAADLAKAARMGAADMVVLKICKAGGIRKCLESAAVAEANGIALLGSGLTDCGIAFAAAIHMFSTLQLALPPELNGPELLEDMLVKGLEITNATVKVPTGPGLGVEPDVDKLKDLKFYV